MNRTPDIPRGGMRTDLYVIALSRRQYININVEEISSPKKSYTFFVNNILRQNKKGITLSKSFVFKTMLNYAGLTDVSPCADYIHQFSGILLPSPLNRETSGITE